LLFQGACDRRQTLLVSAGKALMHSQRSAVHGSAKTQLTQALPRQFQRRGIRHCAGRREEVDASRRFAAMMSMSVVVNMAVLIMAVILRPDLGLCDIIRLRVSRRSPGAGRRF